MFHAKHINFPHHNMCICYAAHPHSLPCKQQQFHFDFSGYVYLLLTALTLSVGFTGPAVIGEHIYMRSITGGIGKYTNNGFTIATLYHSYPYSMLACHLRLEARPKYQGMIVNSCFGNGIGSRYTPDDMFLLLGLLGSTPGWG